MFILPKRIRNCLLLFEFIKSEPITAAWLAPRLGRNVQRGAESKEAIPEFFNCFNVGLTLVIICLGIFSFFSMLVIKEEEPKSPVRSGRREFFIFRFKLEIPRKPARRKIINARILEFCSFDIK